MEKDIALVLFYHKQNRYSFNALVGALETDQYLSDLPIYFLNKKEELFSELNNIIKKHEKVVLGVSFFTTQLWDTRKIIKDLKKEYKNSILFIAGGPHPTGDPTGTLKMGFDIVVVGEGEDTIKELLSIELSTDWAQIKGIAYFDRNGEYIFTGRRHFVNLNNYPPFAIEHGKIQ
ncbi:MAG: cobalamin-dependent protein [Nitrospirota bacterium]|nr:cobalamin-dependent protein [Nitrospirota bacterium]